MRLGIRRNTSSVVQRSSGAALVLSGLAKRYDAVVAVDGVDLVVEPGEFLTLLGPSGSGKTTTLDIVCGFVRADCGEVLIDGRAMGHVPPHRRSVGRVFQHYALFPHLSVFNNVAFPLTQRGVPKREIAQRVGAVLDLVRLTGYERRLPAQLSGGEQQRVAVARAVVFEPGLLLMDEPLGALDRSLREWLQLEIRRIHRELGVTVVYVTHDQDEAMAMSDRIAVFNCGRLVQVGIPQLLYERPESLFVAEFLGESNKFVGRVDCTAGVTTLIGDGITLPVDSTDQVEHGKMMSLVVRPERTRLASPGASPLDQAIALEGRVREALYLGATRKVVVELACGQTVYVRDGGAAETPAPGSRVLVTWQTADAVLLPQGLDGRMDAPGPSRKMEK